MGRNLQLTFFHSIKKPAILSTDSEYFALTGFSCRASAVRIDPKDLFKLTSKKHYFPPFEQLITLRTEQDIMNLVPTSDMDEDKSEHHALLPPILFEELLELEDLRSQNVLLSILAKIRSLKSPEPDQTSEHDDSFDEDGFVDLSNQEVNEDEKSATTDSNQSLNPTFDDENRSYEKKFLWSLCHNPDKINGVPTATCTIPSTMNWLDKIHEEHIPRRQVQPFPIPAARYALPPVHHGPDDNVASSLNKLATTLDFHYENELKERAEKKKKKDEKQYDNLSSVQKTTVKFVTITKDHTEEDAPNLEPTPTMKILLEQSSSIKVQAQLQHEFSKRKHICALSSGMCTSIKQGTIASQPSYTDINGISPFCTPNENKDDKMDHATMLYMSEQLELGKVCAADVKMITKLSITFPKEFNDFVHFLKNFCLLLQLLTGQNSILSEALQSMVDHAIENERTYKDHAEDDWTFYPGVLDHVHKRTQMFIHSAGEGDFNKLKTKQLDFTFLMESIEGYNYVHHTPKWLRTRKRSLDEQSRSNSGGGGNHNSPNRQENDKNKKDNKRGEKLINQHVDAKMKIPQEFKYGDVFRPEQRKGLTPENHDDGSIKCNNWHHRGFCFSKCKLRSSHEKILSEGEKERMRKYSQTLIEKWKKSRGKNE